jgi:hypothetical protein
LSFTGWTHVFWASALSAGLSSPFRGGELKSEPMMEKRNRAHICGEEAFRLAFMACASLNEVLNRLES